MIKTFFFFIFVFASWLFAQAPSILKGRVLERGTKQPLKSVTVFILPQKIKIKTDASGFFQTPLELGNHTVVINIPGFKKLQNDFNFTNESFSLEVLVERSNYNPYETTVQTKASTVQTGQKNLAASEISRIAGTNGDTLRAIQTLPGVARTSYGSGNVSIRGSAPNETKYLVDGLEVPIIYHFGGIASVVNTDLIDEVIYLPGGFNSPYGRANGGIIGVVLRDPKHDRKSGYAFADIINAGFLFETPVSEKWSLGVTARRSYIGDVLKLVAKNNPNFDLTIAPYYYDGLITLSNRISSKERLRFSLLGSYDELSFLLKEPLDTAPAIRGSINNQTRFFRFITSYQKNITDDDLFRFSASTGPDLIQVDANEIYFDLYSMTYSLRSDWEHRFNLHNALRVGIDSRVAESRVRLKVPGGTQEGPVSTLTLVEKETQNTLKAFGLFVEDRLGLLEDPEKWTLTPGVRFDAFYPTGEYLLSPRISSRYEINEAWALRLGTGMYQQAPDPQFSDASYGNSKIQSPLAYHYVLGFESTPSLSWFNSVSLETDFFYKDLKKVIVPDAARRYSNDGSGRAFGFETLFKVQKNRWSGWLSYTFTDSTRTTPSDGEVRFQFDQTHNVNLVTSYKSESNWEYGLRVRYVTGNPFTPVINARFDADNDLYVPERGTPYSRRLRPFFQADFRIDRKWVYDTWILNLYLDIQNLTNYRNVETLSYSYDFSQNQEARGLPTIPSFGIRAEF